jgi:hypothetical protein
MSDYEIGVISSWPRGFACASRPNVERGHTRCDTARIGNPVHDLPCRAGPKAEPVRVLLWECGRGSREAATAKITRGVRRDGNV